MKIPVSTKKTQGQRDNDFRFVQEGEIVYTSWTCTSGFADDECGCRRCLTGVKCGKGTTTVTVIDSLMTRDEYDAALVKSMRRALGRSTSEAALLRMAKACADDLLRRTARYRVGDVLEYRNGRFSVRMAAESGSR